MKIAKSIMTVREKSFYDSLNHFYVDDSRFNHLKVGDYESYTFEIVDTQDTLYDKQLVLATELNKENEVYFESYLAKSSKIIFNDSLKVGDQLNNQIQMKKIETSFSFQKDYETTMDGGCLRVWETEMVPACGDLDDRPRCGQQVIREDGSYYWEPRMRKRYTLLAESCNVKSK